MAKQLQLRRGTTAQHSTFTGAVGEVTIDTDKDVVVVHDGATAGGFPSQKELVSGTNIKTVNSTSLLGSGNIDVVAKVTSTDNAVVRFDGATGSVQNSSVRIADNGDIITSGEAIEVSAYGTGNRPSYIDFHSDDTYTDYGLRVAKDPGANGNAVITKRGTGNLVLYTVDGGEIVLQNSSQTWQTNGTLPWFRGFYGTGFHENLSYSGYSNMNTININSLFNTDPTICTNGPENSWGFIHTMIHSNGATWRTQVWWGMQTNNRYTRYTTNNGSSWSAWTAF